MSRVAGKLPASAAVSLSRWANGPVAAPLVRRSAGLSEQGRAPKRMLTGPAARAGRPASPCSGSIRRDLGNGAAKLPPSWTAVSPRQRRAQVGTAPACRAQRVAPNLRWRSPRSQDHLFGDGFCCRAKVSCNERTLLPSRDGKRIISTSNWPGGQIRHKSIPS
jgi:hypothetical protein